MRIFISLTTLLLILSCNPGPGFHLGANTKSEGAHGHGDGELTPGVKKAVTETEVAKNEPPTLILNPNDVDILGLDLNSALSKSQWEWTANPILPEANFISDSAAYRKIELNMQQTGTRDAGKQMTRQRPSKSLTQGGQSASTQTMSFKSQAAGILDILLVVDSSGSMRDEQEALKENLPSLLTHISKSNWQISVVNTGPNCDFRPPISKTTSNFTEKYMENVLVGARGGTELAVYNAIRSMKGECSNTPWQRNESTIAIIIITDEPHQCQSLQQEVCGTADKLETYLHSIRDPSDVKIFGLIAAGTAWDNESMFDATGDIKDKAKYDEVFQQISDSVNNSLKSSYDLTHTPDNILYVKVDGSVLDSSKYTINGKVITMNDGALPKDRDVDVEVQYTYGHKEFNYELTLDHDPVNRADMMTVTMSKTGEADTVLQYGRDFTVTGRRLAFTDCSTSSCDVFPAGATVLVEYVEDIPLKSRFAMTGSAGHHIVMDSLVVMVNSVAQTISTDFTLQTEPNGDKAILFSAPPVDSAKVDYSYTHMLDLVYRHDLHANNSSNSIACKDAHDMAREIPCSYVNGEVEFATDIGTDTVVIYEQLSSGAFSLNYELKSDYVGSSVAVQCLLGNGSKRGLAHSISANVLSLDEDDYNNCKTSALSSLTSYQVSIAYEVRKDQQDNFYIVYDFFAKYAGQYKFIHVVVEIDSDGDGRFSVVSEKDFNFEFDYYSAEDARVAFLKTLPDNTKIKATVYLLPY